MTKEFDSIQHAADVQLNAVATTLPSFGTILQAIAAEGTDYTKKSMDKHNAFAEKLLGALIHPLIFRRRSFATVGTNFD